MRVPATCTQPLVINEGVVTRTTLKCQQTFTNCAGDDFKLSRGHGAPKWQAKEAVTNRQTPGAFAFRFRLRHPSRYPPARSCCAESNVPGPLIVWPPLKNSDGGAAPRPNGRKETAHVRRLGATQDRARRRVMAALDMKGRGRWGAQIGVAEGAAHLKPALSHSSLNMKLLRRAWRATLRVQSLKSPAQLESA